MDESRYNGSIPGQEDELGESAPVEVLRRKHLEAILKRMQIIAGVFEARADTVEDRGYRSLRDLIDIYVGACHDTLAADQDFSDGDLVITSERAADLKAVLTKIFRKSPEELFSNTE